MAREAGYQIPAITINAINIQTIETHMTNLPQVASVASVKVTSAITILIHIIKAGMEASANSSNPSPSNCQRILPRHHILIKTGCKIIRIRLRTYP